MPHRFWCWCTCTDDLVFQWDASIRSDVHMVYLVYCVKFCQQTSISVFYTNYSGITLCLLLPKIMRCQRWKWCWRGILTCVLLSILDFLPYSFVKLCEQTDILFSLYFLQWSNTVLILPTHSVVKMPLWFWYWSQIWISVLYSSFSIDC